MNKNIGIVDRVLRIVIGLASYGLFVANILTGSLALIFVSVGTVFLLTAFVNICPLYRLIGVKTCSY